jgi:hypothetical protein
MIFCNACGRAIFCTLPIIGETYKVCSTECLREIKWRESLSIMGENYYPDPSISNQDSHIIIIKGN